MEKNTMPFSSESQRRLFWAKVNRGEISRKTAEEWEAATPPGKLPYKVPKEKTSMWNGMVSEISSIIDFVRPELRHRTPSY